MTKASAQIANANDLHVVNALRNELFENVNQLPDDLVARNLQRGREHGIPSYSVLREACGLKPLTTAQARPEEINAVSWETLMKTYHSTPANIDAFTGGLAESTPDDALVGPLFACIIKRQFLKLRDGDRYFFTHKEDCTTSARGLKPVAMKNILNRSLAAIICDNNPNEGQIQDRVFEKPHDTNPLQECSSFFKLDFESLAKEISSQFFSFFLLS